MFFNPAKQKLVPLPVEGKQASRAFITKAICNSAHYAEIKYAANFEDGLGMDISKKSIEQQKKKKSVKRKINEGTEFT